MNNGNQPINVVRGANNAPFDNDGFLESRGMVTGLTKREYFAGLAMKGVIANSSNAGFVASLSVKLADALLAELDK